MFTTEVTETEQPYDFRDWEFQDRTVRAFRAALRSEVRSMLAKPELYAAVPSARDDDLMIHIGSNPDNVGEDVWTVKVPSLRAMFTALAEDAGFYGDARDKAVAFRALSTLLASLAETLEAKADKEDADAT